MERRKFPRMTVNLPMRYYVRLWGAEESSIGKGFLENISEGGMYFKCPLPPPVVHGDIGEFIIDLSSHQMLSTTHINTLAKVVRVEPPEAGAPDFGIAVQFISSMPAESAPT